MCLVPFFAIVVASLSSFLPLALFKVELSLVCLALWFDLVILVALACGGCFLV